MIKRLFISRTPLRYAKRSVIVHSLISDQRLFASTLRLSLAFLLFFLAHALHGRGISRILRGAVTTRDLARASFLGNAGEGNAVQQLRLHCCQHNIQVASSGAELPCLGVLQPAQEQPLHTANTPGYCTLRQSQNTSDALCTYTHSLDHLLGLVLTKSLPPSSATINAIKS